jgi:amino acid transporter
MAAGQHNMEGLGRRVLGPVEIFGQAVGNTGMATVVAVTPALVAASAGNASWLSMLIAMLAILAVGYCCALFARRVATSGSLYTFIAGVLGPGAGFLVGWALLIAYFGLALSIPSLGGLFLGDVLDGIGLDGQSDLAQYALYLVLTVAATAMAFFGVRLSTRVALTLEALCITLLAVIIIAALVTAGTLVDDPQIKLSGFSVHDVFLGITLSVTAFVGFESGASLGAEARDPYRAIPRVILFTAAIAGVIYILSIYTENLIFREMGQDITASASLPDDMAEYAGIGGLRYPIAIGLGFSFFAIMLASINALSRMLFTMAREGVIAPAFGRTHPKHRTPHVGMFAAAPFIFLVPIVMREIAKADAASTFAYLATPATFGFMFAYILIGIGAPLLVYRETGRIHALAVLAGVVAIAAMIATYVANLTPVPAYPFNILPYIFFGLMVLGVVVYLVLRARNPEVTRTIGTVEEEEDLAPA